jgi:hypothetical protein
MPDVTTAFPKPDAQVQPYFEVLGPDLMVDFLLTFGLSEMTISENPQGRSELEGWWALTRPAPLASGCTCSSAGCPLPKNGWHLCWHYRATAPPPSRGARAWPTRPCANGDARRDYKRGPDVIRGQTRTDINCTRAKPACNPLTHRGTPDHKKGIGQADNRSQQLRFVPMATRGGMMEGRTSPHARAFRLSPRRCNGLRIPIVIIPNFSCSHVAQKAIR